MTLMEQIQRGKLAAPRRVMLYGTPGAVERTDRSGQAYAVIGLRSKVEGRDLGPWTFFRRLI
jgi:hypothetical protein